MERWHLRDDEQFDLAAWFPSLIQPALSLCGGVVFYFGVASAVELLLVSPACGCDEIHFGYSISVYLHLVIRMNNELRLAIGIYETFAIVVELHRKAILWKGYQF